MNARTVRPLLVIAQVALHAAVVLCGPCLHALPGSGHGSGVHASAKDRHDGGPARLPHGPSHDCLVCQFLAQGQLPAEIARQTTAQVVTPLGPLPLPQFAIPPARGPSRPRAPPLLVPDVA